MDICSLSVEQHKVNLEIIRVSKMVKGEHSIAEMYRFDIHPQTTLSNWSQQ
jgi:hypothetical protein